MHYGRTALLGFALAAGGLSGAAAGTRIDLSTVGAGIQKWTVRENTRGRVSAPSVVNTGYNWGDVPAITIPFTDCDGFWVAKRSFQIPAGVTDALLVITRLGADDRAVVKLNGVVIATVGTNSKGAGSMQFKDPGFPRPYKFKYVSGPVRISNTRNLQPGSNELQVIINNTNAGIHGMTLPVGLDGQSEFGITASVSYTP